MNQFVIRSALGGLSLLVLGLSLKPIQASHLCDSLLSSLHGIQKQQLIQSWQAQPGEALHIVFEDWDDNLMIMHPSRIYVMNAKTGQLRGITTDEYAKHKGQMGKPGSEWEDWHFFDYLVHPDGREVLITLEKRNEISALLGKPGAYEQMRLREGSWIDFRDIPDPQIFQNHVDQITQEPRGWTGPRWLEAVRRLSRDRDRARLGVITTRGHHPSAFVAAQELLKERNLLPAVMSAHMIFPIYNSRFPQNLGAWPHERKFSVLLAMMETLKGLPVNDPSQSHTLEFADDDIKTIQFLREKFGELQIQGQLVGIRIVIEQTNLNSWGHWEFHNPPTPSTLKTSLSLPVRVSGRAMLSSEEFKILQDETGFTEDELLLALASEVQGVAARTGSGKVYFGRTREFRSNALRFLIGPEQDLIAALAMASESHIQRLAFHKNPPAQARQYLLELKASGDLLIILPDQTPIRLHRLLPHAPEVQSPLLKEDYLNRKPHHLQPVDGEDLIQQAFEFARWSFSPDLQYHAGVAIELTTGERFYGFSIQSETRGQNISAAQMAFLELLRAQRQPNQIARVAMIEASRLPQSQEEATKLFFSLLAPMAIFEFRPSAHVLR